MSDYPVVSPDTAYVRVFRALDALVASAVHHSLQKIARLTTAANQGDAGAVQELHMVLFGDWPLHVTQGMRFSTRAEAETSQLAVSLTDQLPREFLKHGWATYVEVARALPPHGSQFTLAVRINHADSIPSVD